MSTVTRRQCAPDDPELVATLAAPSAVLLQAQRGTTAVAGRLDLSHRELFTLALASSDVRAPQQQASGVATGPLSSAVDELLTLVPRPDGPDVGPPPGYEGTVRLDRLAPELQPDPVTGESPFDEVLEPLPGWAVEARTGSTGSLDLFVEVTGRTHRVLSVLVLPSGFVGTEVDEDLLTFDGFRLDTDDLVACLLSCCVHVREAACSDG